MVYYMFADLSRSAQMVQALCNVLPMAQDNISLIIDLVSFFQILILYEVLVPGLQTVSAVKNTCNIKMSYNVCSFAMVRP